MGRIAFRADGELEQRLDSVVEAMRRSPSLRHMEITRSTVIKAALGYGLPFLELDHNSENFGSGDETIEGWLHWLRQYAGEWMDSLDLTEPDD